jgi:hypothetical protein
MLENIEDILEYINQNNIASTSDCGILYSIARQVARGTALTDLQFELAKNKVQAYQEDLASKFGSQEDFETAVNTLRQPLRSVNRLKTVTVTDEGTISVRFPFNKKTIVLIDELATKFRRFYKHAKGTHEHSFKFNELTVEAVVEKFKEKSFYIEPKLLEHYQKITAVRAESVEVVPGVYNNQLKNFRPAAVELMQAELGSLNNNNRLLYFDRRERYGIAHFEFDRPEGLLGEMLYRADGQVAISPTKYRLQEVIDVLHQLQRFPLLVLVDELDALKQVSTIYNSISNVFSNTEQTVLFRVENNKSTEYNLNNFIKDNGLNNWLDKTTKVVYISKDKLPKLLLRNEWQPMAVLGLSSLRSNNSIQTYTLDATDLVVFYDEDLSLIRKTRTNGYY